MAGTIHSRIVLNQRIAAVLAAIKWPCALACAAFLPATALELGEQVLSTLRGARHALWFGCGAAAYLVLWQLLLRRSKVSFLSTLEHELTHCLFAWLTGNRVVALTATLRRGGEMHYRGTPNWLILTGPYFFPTVSVALLLVLRFAAAAHEALLYALIGASVVYHVISTWIEAHRRQTDLREAGWLFSVLFLPTANLFCYALVFAWLRPGDGALMRLLGDLAHSPANPLRWLS